MERYKAMEIAESRYLIRQVENGNIRRCDDCGAYVNVEDYCSEYEGNVVEVCDECLDNFLTGKDTEVYETEFYEDILEELEEEEEEEEY